MGAATTRQNANGNRFQFWIMEKNDLREIWNIEQGMSNFQRGGAVDWTKKAPAF